MLQALKAKELRAADQGRGSGWPSICIQAFIGGPLI